MSSFTKNSQAYVLFYRKKSCNLNAINFKVDESGEKQQENQVSEPEVVAEEEISLDEEPLEDSSDDETDYEEEIDEEEDDEDWGRDIYSNIDL